MPLGFISKTKGGNVQQVRFESLRITGFVFVDVESVATVSLACSKKS